MASNSFLAADVDLLKLAELTKNFSGAELEGLVKSAASYALNRNVDINDLHKPLDEENIKVGARWSTGRVGVASACVGGGGWGGARGMGEGLPGSPAQMVRGKRRATAGAGRRSSGRRRAQRAVHSAPPPVLPLPPGHHVRLHGGAGRGPARVWQQHRGP